MEWAEPATPPEICTIDEILEQDVLFKSWWWKKHVDPSWWPAAIDDLPQADGDTGHQRITRRDVFALANDNTDKGHVGLLVGAYIWGTGAGGFLVGRRARTFTKTPIEEVGAKLSATYQILRNDGPVVAYASMAAGGDNHIKYLGPAFFTKFLYFVGGQPPIVTPQPLILDRVVANSLNQTFGSSLPSTNWSASTYGAYLALAEQQSLGRGTPDGFELGLFNL